MTYFRAILLTLAFVLTSAHAWAAWPERPVKFIVPFPAGGPADAAMRIVGKRLSEVWGQSVIVENRPGVPGIISVKTATPDGYTLLLGAASGIVTNPLVNRKLSYQPSDFAPIGLLATSSSILTVHPSLNVNNLNDFIKLVKAKPRFYDYSSSGLGSPGHLEMEMFQQRTNTKMTHIPYKGGAPAVIDLVAGQVKAGINATPSVLVHVKNGSLVAIAVTSNQRDRSLPNVPTMLELGMAGFAHEVWYGVLAPMKTPKLVIEKASTDIRRVLAEASIEKQIQSRGNEIAPSTADDMGKRINAETLYWKWLIRSRNLSVDE